MTNTPTPIQILIVDDDEDDFFLAQDLLEEIGRDTYVLEWASSYEAGLHKLGEKRHHLCLMDYKLGAHDGIELLRIAQQQGFSGPVILLTGMRQGEVDIQAVEAGAVDYLVKAELTAEQLQRSIHYALARREAELERVERLRAEAENRSKSEFLAHLSHELRTPLSAVLGFTELLLNKSTEPDQLSHLQVIQRNGKHLLGLLNDILDLSKIEAGKLELESHWINLTTFLSDIYLLMKGTAEDKNLSFTLQASSDLPLHIQTDPTRLRQVLLNLIGNALKFTDEGGVTVIVTYQPQHEDALIFSIRDTGLGISAAHQKTIFEPFVQSTDKSLNTTPGTGLGLAISRQLVEKLGGSIHLSSELGTGSEFQFSICPGETSQLQPQTFNLQYELEALKASDVPQFSGRVLVVDDLEDIRTLIGHFVALTGVSVDFAADGEEACQQIEHTSYDMVLMDIHMPVLDGHNAAKRLRAIGYKVPLIALTAAHMQGDRDKCFASGFSNYLSKPVDQQSLYQCLGEYLSSVSRNPEAEPQDAQQASPILLVEDNPDARQAMAQLLELSGYPVLTAGTATEALEHINMTTPLAVLTDLNLPDLDGYQLAKEIQRLRPDTPIIALSGEQADDSKSAQVGISQHLIKPVGLPQLQQAINALK